MRHRPSPSPFRDPLQRDYLKTIERTHQDPITRTLLWEIARFHSLLRDIEGDRQAIAKELASHGGGQLAAAHKLRVRLSPEPALHKPPSRPRAAAREPDPMFPDDPPYDPALDAK